eukprot:gene3312-3633_t
MRVKVLVRGHELEISCGDGKQTFQWLVAAIQGRLRTFQTLRGVLDSDHHVVSEIRNLNDELINPRDKLYEHASTSGLTVKATIDTLLSVDEWENPVMNDWQQAAYLHSAVGQHWSKEIEIWRTNLAKLKDSTPAAKGSEVDFNTSLLAQRVMPQTSQLIKIGFDFSQEDLESAFHLDWKVVYWEWIPLGELQKSRVGDILKSNYSLICNIFAHYAGTGKVGQRYGMTLEELGHFFHFIRCVNWKESEEHVEEIFFKTVPAAVFEKINSSTGPSSTSSSSSSSSSSSKRLGENWPLMTRAHFATALVCAAGEFSPASKIEESLFGFLQGPVNNFWDSITAKYLAYSCPDPALKLTLMEYYHISKQVFHQRSAIDAKFGPRLSAADFQELMEETGLVDSERESACVACFASSQLNPPVNLELHYMVFVEFVEALSRMALRSIEDINGLTEAKRVRMTLNMIAELPVRDKNHK